MTMKLWPILLSLFDGEGSGEGAAAPQGEAQQAPGTTRQGFDGVKFGKQEAEPAPEPEAAPRDLESEWKTMISGEYKDIFTRETQKLINRRFKETKGLQEQLNAQQGIMDTLMERYNVNDISKLTAAIDNDVRYWNDAAEEAGMDVEQYKKVKTLERDNRQLLRMVDSYRGNEAARNQLAQWNNEAEQLKAKFPDFDLQTESQDQNFLSMLKSGVPMEHAYKVLHYDQIMQDTIRTTAADTEKKIVDNVRAKGARPQENGTASRSSFTVKDDVSKLTKAERAEIARRVMAGERITF